MAENKILPWAQTSTANALSDADYAADVARGGSYADGVKSGQASSKQANKTWRQATAPGAGLAQFLVDNLAVDVTDADTPATFSARIANAVLKLAQISPFNQSWATATGGYRKYAIVSDSSGNFWVSTADQNTTVPGADGASWQSLFNGYATESWANTTFQPAGDYATNPALQSVNTNLQNQINNRVLKTGDTINWLNCNGEITVRGSNPSTNNGDWNYSPGINFGYDKRLTADLFAQEHVGVTNEVVIRCMWNGSAVQYWWFNQSGDIRSRSKGAVAFESDLPLPVGMHCQIFTVDIPNPVPADGWIVNIPTGWSTHLYVTGCDTGANVYVVSAKVENSSQARVWAKFPTNGALATGGVATISSFGYF